jgi:hypothetical protein
MILSLRYACALLFAAASRLPVSAQDLHPSEAASCVRTLSDRADHIFRTSAIRAKGAG